MARRWIWASLGLTLVVVPSFAGCGGDESGKARSGAGDAGAEGGPAACPADAVFLEQDCDPIGGYCGLPFPSNVYLKADPSGKNPSGKSVRFGAETLPKSTTGTPFNPELAYGLDGFSPASTAMAYLPGATANGLPTPNDIASTLEATSPTILLDAETGELVPHFTDIDAQAVNEDQRLVMIHPAVLLTNERRYIAAIRHVKDASGSDVAPAPAFAAIRDGTDSSEPSVLARKCLYDDIFAKLEKAGVERESLQLAWDFTVGSIRSITGPLIDVRDAALAAVGEDGPEFTVKVDEARPPAGADDANCPASAGWQCIRENPNPYILRRLILTMKAPLYLHSATYATGGATVPHLLWGADGKPQQNGTMDVDVLVQIPNSVTTAGKHGLLQNGHGLFGGKGEGQNGYLAMAADGWHWITLATDLFGFANADVAIAVEGLGGRSEMLPGFMDRQIQGHVNQLVAMRMMKGRVARDGVQGASGEMLLDPAWVDSSLRAYRGDSQGGIMGGTYMAVSTDVTRGLLGEPGTPYSVLLNRSKDSILYNGLLQSTYGDDRAVQLVWAMIQLFWDRTEPSGFVPHLATSPFPNTPDHRVLLHAALGDHQVTTQGAHIMARAVSAKLLQSNDTAAPFIRDVFGLEHAAAPIQGESAIVEWDFALPPEPLGNVPPLAGCDPHDRVRVLTPAFEQQDHFFRTGEIDWYCDGLCNCDGANQEGNCDGSYKDQCCDAGATDPRCL